MNEFKKMIFKYENDNRTISLEEIVDMYIISNRDFGFSADFRYINGSKYFVMETFTRTYWVLAYSFISKIDDNFDVDNFINYLHSFKKIRRREMVINELLDINIDI